MSLPFTIEQFFGVFARYNEGVWPMQYLLVLLALVCIVLLFRPSRQAGRIISLILAFFQAWMAVTYHFTFFSQINPAAWLFGALFLFGAAIFVWKGVVNGQLSFRYSWKWPEIIGAGLIIYALAIYPVIGYFAGHRYPATPSFGLPCPTTIFTLGCLSFAHAPAPYSVFIVPLLWSAIGSVAAFQLGVLQDLGLLLAGVAGIVFLLSNRRLLRDRN